MINCLISGPHPARHCARAAVVLWLAIGMAGCASNPTGGTDFVLMSEEKELEIGAQMHPQILREYGVYQDQQLNDYVNSIGQKLAAVSHRPEITYRFTVLDDDAVNAFATPGGYIYITRGIMAYMNSEAELAAVLGHEIGHVTARHSVQQHSKSSVLGAMGTVASMATGVSQAGDLTNYAGGALLSGYGRKDELQADQLGAQYLALAGYPPDAMLKVLSVLKQKEQFEIEQAQLEGRDPQVYHGVFASHPDSDTRLQEVVASADSLQASGTVTVNAEQYLNHINGMVYGESASGMVFRGNLFYHTGLGIKVAFPQDWNVRLASDRIIAVAPDGSAAMMFGTISISQSTVPKTVLRRDVKATNLRDQNVATVDGKPALLAISDRADSPFGPRPTRYAVVTDSGRRVAFVFGGAGRDDRHEIADDPAFIRTIFSLDDMTQEDYYNARPPTIGLMKADTGMRFETLAEDSVIAPFAEQQLRLLNQAYPSGEPVSGETLKVVR